MGVLIAKRHLSVDQLFVGVVPSESEHLKNTKRDNIKRENQA